MRKWLILCAAACGAASAATAACGGDDVSVTPPGSDGGAGDAGTKDAASDATAGGDQAAPPVDAATDSGAVDAPKDAPLDAPKESGADGGGAEAGVDAGAIEPHLLLSYNGTSSSELVAVNVVSGQIDGRIAYPGFIGTTSTQGPDPWLLEQANDVVAKLDRARPWIVDGSWNVKMNDQPDGGSSYSDPDAVVVPAGNKAYVLRYTRNEIAILDPSQSADAGAPIGAIDLSPYVHADDSDGRVDMTAGVYVPSKGLVYVVLGNADLNRVSTDGFTILCTASAPTVMAIDVATDKVVRLAGGDANGALPLLGYDPVLGIPLVYDGANDRLIVVEGGCNVDADGGAGALQQRVIEQVSLFTGTAATLLDAKAQGFPLELTYLDAHRAIVQFSVYPQNHTFLWDPASPALGPEVTGAPDAFTWDGQDSLVGVSTVATGDGGTETDVVSVRIADGKRRVLAQNPFSLTGGFVGGVDLWPHP